MLALDPEFRALNRSDGYQPVEDMGLIGDGNTTALVGLDGTIGWMCIPRFDSEPVFCGLLDRANGGHLSIAPRDIVAARQSYDSDTAALNTDLRTPTDVVRVTDALAVRQGADLTDDAHGGRDELVRSAVVLDGSVQLTVDVQLRGGVQHRAASAGLEVRASRRPDPELHLRSNRPLSGLHTTHHLEAGERLNLVLSWAGSHRHHRFDAQSLLESTVEAWRRWMGGFRYTGPEPQLVRRAAITLKLCDYWSNGALVAAPTSSLPAPVGGVRNWDYRYAWVRDASYSVYAFAPCRIRK